jgi:hypothetical protein
VPVVIDDPAERAALVPAVFLSLRWTWLGGGEATPALGARVTALPAENDVARVSRPVNPENPVQETRATPLARAASLRWHGSAPPSPWQWWSPFSSRCGRRQMPAPGRARPSSKNRVPLRLRQTPRVSPPRAGINVCTMRHRRWFAPLRGDPRFVALLNDPNNDAPLF